MKSISVLVLFIFLFTIYCRNGDRMNWKKFEHIESYNIDYKVISFHSLQDKLIIASDFYVEEE